MDDLTQNILKSNNNLADATPSELTVPDTIANAQFAPDWKTIIGYARFRGYFTNQEWQWAFFARTTLVGVRAMKEDGGDEFDPWDLIPAIRDIFVDFARAVKQNNFDEADKMLKTLEDTKDIWEHTDE